MIRVLDTKYKSIGNILVIPSSEAEPFYVKSPIDFLLDKKDEVYSLCLRYTSYNDTFDYESCKIIATLEGKDESIVVLYTPDYLIPDENNKEYMSGYCLSYKLSYNKDNNRNLFMLFKSKPLCLPQNQ